MQPESAEQCDDNVPKCRGWHNECQVGPAEGGHVAGKESDEQQDSDVDVGIEQRMPQQAQVVHVYGADISHAPRQQGIAKRSGQRYGEQDEVTLRR